jgi:hypothetical protein
MDEGGYIDILLVGGGGCGGGAQYHGAGGGAGDIKYEENYKIYVGVYSVVVGDGGTVRYTNGQDSQFADLLSVKGGGFGGDESHYNGNDGGSGGGATKGGIPGVSVGLLGHNGGAGGGAPPYYGQGGGGGAGASGGNGTPLVGGNGGDGVSIYSELLSSAMAGVTISGVRWIGGGGGGSTYNGGTPGMGGKGGGGNGSIGNASPGILNSGGGGGGSERAGSGNTGTGGSGIVIIRYNTGSIVATGGIVIVSGGKTIHKFISTGVFEVISISLPSKKRNSWFADPYMYKATTSGVSIYSTDSITLLNNVFFPYGANSVWANDSYLYMATSVSGIYRCPISTISGTLSFEEYKSYPNITANDVNYIHGSGDFLCAATISGVDRYKLSSGEREYTNENYVTKCFQLSNGDYYYVVNSFYNILGLDDNIFSWNYGRIVELSAPIPEDNYQLSIEIPITQLDDIYQQSQQSGDDIRIIDNNGVSVPYYIELWDHAALPKICVKLSRNVTKFYILYGNSRVEAKSSGKDTYRLFDDFEDVSLSNIWVFHNGGYSGNTYTIYDSSIRLNTYSDSYPIALISVDLFYNSVVEYSFKRVIVDQLSSSDLDWQVGFDGGAIVYIGVSNVLNQEYPHYLSSASSQGTIYGTKFVSTSFKTHTLVESLNYQMSNYDGETLVSSGTLLNPNLNPIKFTYRNASYQPKIEIDWIRVRNYDPTPPTYIVNRGQSIDDLFTAAKLCAVYNGGGGYVYEPKQGNLLKSSYISDIYVTEGTSRNENGNVIFLATSWGANIIEEKRGDESNSTKRLYLLSS